MSALRPTLVAAGVTARSPGSTAAKRRASRRCGDPPPPPPSSPAIPARDSRLPPAALNKRPGVDNSLSRLRGPSSVVRPPPRPPARPPAPTHPTQPTPTALDQHAQLCPTTPTRAQVSGGSDTSQSKLGEAHRMRLPVRMRIHWGIGRFCFSFFASVFFVFKLLFAGCRRAEASVSGGKGGQMPSSRISGGRSKIGAVGGLGRGGGGFYHGPGQATRPRGDRNRFQKTVSWRLSSYAPSCGWRGRCTGSGQDRRLTGADRTWVRLSRSAVSTSGSQELTDDVTR